MGNRVTLYNLNQAYPATYLYPTSADLVPEHLRRQLPSLKYTEIGETNNTGIPIPWMLYFGYEDFQETSRRWNKNITYRLQIPCISVEKARQRILAALPIFEHLSGNADIAKEYWQAAIDRLNGLPYPYITMDHTEAFEVVGDSNDFEKISGLFKMGYEKGLPSNEFLMTYSAYTANVSPYSQDEWDKYVSNLDWFDSRQMNAIAMGYGS